MSGSAPWQAWRTLIVLCAGSFAILMDTTIVNVAVPDLSAGLGAGLDGVLWINNVYQLVFGVLLITMSRLADRFGARTLFLTGLAVFGLASVLCGLAPDVPSLVVARAVQGVGAAMISPQPLVIIAAVFPDDRRGTALGFYNSVLGLAAVLGPVVGGLLVTHVGWRWIFFVNAPITVLGILFGSRYLPAVRPRRRSRLDTAGAALVTLGLACLMFGLIEGERYRWGAVAGGPLTIPEVLLAGGVLLVAFVLWERHRREADPLLPLALFTDRGITLLVVLTGVVQFVLLGLLLVLTFDLQSVLGLSATEAGLTTMPLMAVLTVVAPLAGRLSARMGGRAVLVAGFLVYAGGLVALALVAARGAGPAGFVLPLACCGSGMACLLAPLVTEALRRTPPGMTAALAGCLSTSRQIGAALGGVVVGAVLASLLVAGMRGHAETSAAGLSPGDRAAFLTEVHRSAGAVPQPGTGPFQARLHEVFALGYADAARTVLVLLAVLLVLGAVCCVVVLRRARAVPVPVNAPARAPS
ncbi:DHA2 family efflux MFS transporter permease subunit [Amycolatopsis sacchari]|uniref:DHA2 family efflux MFS transporter permease subunit n=1 Tax=Amycolatopsis sacchari TaxID=115433 RepID=UPI003D702452